jgi:hypothetical protein
MFKLLFSIKLIKIIFGHTIIQKYLYEKKYQEIGLDLGILTFFSIQFSLRSREPKIILLASKMTQK